MALDMYNKPISVASQCLAIVLCKPDGRDLNSYSGSHSARSARDGQKIFADFQSENCESFWNPALVESVTSLDYVGFMKPGTLLVSGSELHLECLRGAWARRVLKPPRGYSIRSLGDVGGIEVQAVPQTQFIPLPEVLCLLISSLNRSGQPATTDTIVACLQDQYAGMTVPRPEVLFAALGALVAEGKVYCMGDHYFLSTPLMYQQYQAGFMQAHGGQMFEFPTTKGRQPSKQLQEMCSRECQTGASIVNGVPAYKPQGKGNNSKKDQATSAQEKKTTPDLNKDRITRSKSLREKNAEGKDKQGFFARLFRRSKSRDAKARNKKEENCQQGKISSKDQPPIENPPLATFSAQFPPPEWIHDPRHIRQATHHGQPLFFKNRKARNEKSDKTALKPDRHSVWIDLEPPSKGNRRARNEFRSSAKKFSTVPENLSHNSTGQYSPKIERPRTGRNKPRLSKYLSSSSECLHYLGSIDRPTHLNLEDQDHSSHPAERAVRHSNRNRQKRSHQQRETGNLERFPVTEPVKSSSSSKKSSSDDRKKESDRHLHLAPLAVPTASELDTTGTDFPGDRTCTPVEPAIVEEAGRISDSDKAETPLKATQHSKQNSDSALSVSPVVTEMSSTSGDSNKYSSWSGSEGQQQRPDPVGADPLDHTYINVNLNDEPPRNQPLPSPIVSADRTYENLRKHMESTQFENVTDLDLDESLEENRNSCLQVSTTIVRLSSALAQVENLENTDKAKSKKNKLATAYISTV